jgi:hypothetical protein
MAEHHPALVPEPPSHEKPYHGLMKPKVPVIAVGDIKPEIDQRLTRDMVSLPSHYARWAIEPIRFIAENKLDFERGNAIKYLMRCDAKNGLEDLAKARRYIDMFEDRYFHHDPLWWIPRNDPRRAEAKGRVG